MSSEEYLGPFLELMERESRMRFTGVPDNTEGRRMLLRSYMNVRAPSPIPEDLLRIQDDYLKERNSERGVSRSDDIPTVDVSLGSDIPSADRIALWQGDITTLDCDAIVNAANSQMLGCFQPCHACIDNCIHTYSGMQLRMECNRQMTSLRNIHGMDYEQPTSMPMLTDAYNLPSKKVIHVVGPIINGPLNTDDEMMLAQCYTNVLDMCRDNGLRSVAFCCISTGVFHFPNERAAEIAVDTVAEWLKNDDSIEKVIFNVFLDKDKRIYEQILS
ncbi:MAG: protein-ADP-ribose hydrolase [Candidatus Methanomethylophilaceae archaeon]|nr:protein-ADP-ribose hydrolase [Candidatus Methanomethylophilaceae archaeon]